MARTAIQQPSRPSLSWACWWAHWPSFSITDTGSCQLPTRRRWHGRVLPLTFIGLATTHVASLLISKAAPSSMATMQLGRWDRLVAALAIVVLQVGATGVTVCLTGCRCRCRVLEHAPGGGWRLTPMPIIQHAPGGGSRLTPRANYPACAGWRVPPHPPCQLSSVRRVAGAASPPVPIIQRAPGGGCRLNWHRGLVAGPVVQGGAVVGALNSLNSNYSRDADLG
jgi:hypothetical protein